MMLRELVFSLLLLETAYGLISKEQLRQHLEDFYSDGRSHLQIEEKERVRVETNTFFENLHDSLPEDLKDAVEVSNHTYTGNEELGDGINIILTVKGTRYGTEEDEVSLIGAHYDSQTNTPGVDDDGSGMAALLEIARVLVDVVATQRCDLKNSIIIIGFDHEEFGLRGSRAYVKYLVSDILEKYNIENFQGAYILETILNFDDTDDAQIVPTGLDQVFPEEYELIKNNNFRGDFLINIVRIDDLPLADLITEQWYQLVGGNFTTTEKYRQLNIAAPYSGNPLSWHPLVQLLLRDLFRSDHYSFWTHNSTYTQDGLKAVFVTDTAEYRGEMIQCYHNPCDDLSLLNDDKMEFLQVASEVFLRAMVVLSTGSDDVQCLYADTE